MIFLSVLRTEQSQTTYFLESTLIRMGSTITINSCCPLILLCFSENQAQDKVINLTFTSRSAEFAPVVIPAQLSVQAGPSPGHIPLS